MLLEHTDQPILGISTVVNLPQIANFITDGFEKMNNYMEELGQLTSDVPHVGYLRWKEMYQQKPITVCIILPTSKLLPGKDDIGSDLVPAGKIITCMFRGSYADMGECYASMEKWAEERGLELTGDCMEMYYNGAGFDESDFLTRVIMPVK